MRSLNSTGCKEGFFIRPPRLRKIELPISTYQLKKGVVCIKASLIFYRFFV